MEYVPSYTAMCFQPEVCFYGLLFPSGGSEQCPGETCPGEDRSQGSHGERDQVSSETNLSR